MEKDTFGAKIISGHRITIREDIFEDLDLNEGDKVLITVRKIKGHMQTHAVVTG